MNVRVGVLQLPARWNDREGALQDADKLLEAHELDLAVLPECSLTGYVSEELSFDLRPFAESLEGPTVQALSALARKRNVALVGPLIERDGAAFFNSTVVLDASGALVASYRKRHPWYPETWATEGANETPVVSLRLSHGILQCALAVCFDAQFLLEEEPRALFEAGLLVFPSAWVERGRDSRPALLGEIARRFDVAVANANWGPGAPRVYGQGLSAIYGRDGRALARAARDAGTVLVSAALEV